MTGLLCRGIGLLVTAVVVGSGIACAESNIDPSDSGNKYGWSESGGWVNLQGNQTHGVYVDANVLSGLAWHENFGWINFGDGQPAGQQYSNTTTEDFGVNIDAQGNLSGYAWGENIGWINFDTTASGGAAAKINRASGMFTGYAWGENVGWIAFETVPPSHVAQTVGHTDVTNWTLYR